MRSGSLQSMGSRVKSRDQDRTRASSRTEGLLGGPRLLAGPSVKMKGSARLGQAGPEEPSSVPSTESPPGLSQAGM